MAIDSAAAAGPQPQARSTAEDGRARVSCGARNARSAGEESRRQAVAGSRPASDRERIAALDPPAAGRKERRSKAVTESLGSAGFSPAMTEAPHRQQMPYDKKARLLRAIDEVGNGSDPGDVPRA
jgi:hypothetical protein